MLKVARFGFYLFGINTYVVYDPESKDAAIIDPGMSRPEENEAIENFIAREDLKVRHLINTHLHVDHAVGDEWVAEKYGVPVSAHPEEAPLGLVLAQQAQRFGLKGINRKVEIGKELRDGDKVKIGEDYLEVLHVPGHSPGSIALYSPTSGFVIDGDTLFPGSIGRTDLMGGDHKTLINAIKTKLMTLPENTLVLSGHGDATTIGDEARHNPYL